MWGVKERTDRVGSVGRTRAHASGEMKFLWVLVGLLFASPAFSQSPRDLLANRGLGVSTALGKLSPAEAAAILAPNQFQLPAPSPNGPRVIGIHSSSTAGPFGEFRAFSPARR